MNESCNKCGAPLERDGSCSYHTSSAVYQTVQQSETVEAVDQSNSEVYPLVAAVVFFIAVLCDLGAIGELYAVSDPASLALKVIRIPTALYLGVYYLESDKMDASIMWFFVTVVGLINIISVLFMT